MATSNLISPNFSYLLSHSPELVRLGSQAERYFGEDPNTCLMKLRQFGELLARLVAAKVGLYQDSDERQVDLLGRLAFAGAIASQSKDLFHEIRRSGNAASHSGAGDHRTALTQLKYARALGVWFHRSYGGAQGFKPGPFVPPPDPAQAADPAQEELQAELATLRAAVVKYETDIATIAAQVQSVESLSRSAQRLAQEEAELRQIAEALLIDAETEAVSLAAQLAAVQAQTIQAAPQAIQATITLAQQAGDSLDLLDERATRQLIDAQLRAAGWEVDSQGMTYGHGVRPQKGKNVAIAEWPMKGGRADYVLFVGLQAIAAIEAKRDRTDIYSAIDQAKRYSSSYRSLETAAPQPGPWGEYQLPFVFATNGRAYLRQLETKSGIWFCDLRQPTNLRRAIGGWYSPQGLIDLLGQNHQHAHQQLVQEPFHYGVELRPYQIQAIQAVETALSEGQRTLLLAMATGTGKTKTCIAMVYRLLKVKRFRRVLFLVDRTALGEQAQDAFQETRLENLQTFADVFDIKTLQDQSPDRDTKVQVATVQSLVRRLFDSGDEGSSITTDQYDCIVVDECHRGYLLDRELSEGELSFRDFGDYMSKYRQVLDYFDAVKIGLTATPALQTREIFGDPIFTYSYREAVIDGYLVDHEPPFRITTTLSEDGIVWQAGAEVQYFDPTTGQIDLSRTPDEIRVDVEKFNRQVITESFNRVVCDTNSM